MARVVKKKTEKITVRFFFKSAFLILFHCISWVSMKAGVRTSCKVRDVLIPSLYVNNPQSGSEGMTKVVMSWPAHFMLHYHLIMRHALSVALVSLMKRRKKKTSSTLEHCLWFWHQTKDPLFCKREGKISSINSFNYQVVTWNVQIWPSPLWSHSHSSDITANSRYFKRVSFACNPSRKEGSAAPEGENLWSVSAERGELSFSEGPVWSLNRRPRGHRGEKWCRHSCVDFRYCQFPLIAVEVPPSPCQPCKHLALIARAVFLNPRCVNMGSRRAKDQSGGVNGVCKWSFPEFH